MPTAAAASALAAFHRPLNFSRNPSGPSGVDASRSSRLATTPSARMSNARTTLCCCRPGYDFTSKNLLQLSIVVPGTGLSLQQVVQVGGSSLPVMLGTLAVALGGAWLFGGLLGVRGDTRTLIGVGTAI